MRALLIGGTGNISLYVSMQLLRDGWELYLLNRGKNSKALLSALKKENISKENLHLLYADIRDEASVLQAIDGLYFDTVAQFIAYFPKEAKRDIRLFSGRCDQYIFISSASCYKRPCLSPYITESSPLYNPYWQYSRDKIACEQLFMDAYHKDAFPVTIVRPSHTYGDSKLPLAIHGHKGSWQTVQRIIEEKPVIIPGDGTSLWTLTHSRDFAKGFVGLMGKPQAIGESYHITADEAYPWLLVYQLIAKLLRKTLHPLFVPSSLLAKSVKYDFKGALLGDKSSSVLFDNSKLKRLVPSFVCEIPLEKGIERALNAFLADPALQVPDTEFDAFSDKLAAIFKDAEIKMNKDSTCPGCEG